LSDCSQYNNIMNNEPSISTIGDRIKLAINCRGTTQKRVSEIIEISEDAMVNYIKNRRIPPLKTILKIAETCYVESGWLVNGAINIKVVETLIKSMSKFPKNILLEVASNLGISQIYFDKLFLYEFEPSFKFIKDYDEFVHGETYDSKFITLMRKQKRISTATNLFPSEKPNFHNPQIEEILNYLQDDDSSQKIVLELLRSLKKREK
jgi:transcriptional regulator with XRE-family HTH domain